MGIQTPDEILQVLKHDASFCSLLGEYWFNDDGSGADLTAHAISILAANEQLPSLDRIVGLECVVSRTPNVTPLAFVSTQSPALGKTWKVYLVEYPGADPNDLMLAADRICNLFVGSSYAVTYTSGEIAELAGIQQAVVTIGPWVCPTQDTAALEATAPNTAVDYGFTYENVTCSEDYGGMEEVENP